MYGRVTRWIGRTLSKLRPSPVFGPNSDTIYYSRKVDRYFLTETVLDRGFNRMFESLAGIRRYLAERDVRFLLVIMPSLHAYSGDSYFPGSRRLIGRAEERARELDLPFVSLYGTLGDAGGAELFMDFCHPTVEGNLAITRALLETIETWSP